VVAELTIRIASAISTDTPGRVPKADVIAALQGSGESYDRVRETLKGVSVDASGKVEVEDWVEVSDTPYVLHDRALIFREPSPISSCPLRPRS
jgi:hypothetical protein